MRKDITIGIDLGTTTLKAVFADVSACKIITTRTEEIYPVKTDNPDRIEFDPQDWLEGTRSLLGRGFEAGVEPDRVAGICFSGWTVMALLCDSDGIPLTNAIHYNDMRHLPELAELDSLTGRACVAKNGNYISAYSGLAKQYWWKKHRPDVFSRACSLHTEASWMVRRLTGRDVWNRAEAGFYGWYNAEKRDWDGDIIRHVGFPRGLFPPLLDSWEIAGHVTNEAAALTGLPTGTPVIAGADDASPAALATGVIEEGQCFLSAGSAANLAANTSGPVSHPTIITYPHCIPGLSTAITVMSSTGLSNKWVRNALCHAEAAVAEITGGDPYDYMNRAAASSKPGANGVLFLPYLDGDFTPNNDPGARACFVGMDSSTTKADMLRAVLEGVAFSIMDNVALIRDVSGKLDEIVLTGGLSKSDIWMQIIADVTGCVLSLPEESEGTALGDAMLAGLGTGLFASCAEAAQKMVCVNRGAYKPDMNNHRLYKDLFAVYKALYPALKDVYVRMGAFRNTYY